MAAILLSKPLIVKSTGIEGIVVGQTLYNSETGEFVQQDGTILAQPSSQEVVPPLEKE
jgi:hypothetical protein